MKPTLMQSVRVATLLIAGYVMAMAGLFLLASALPDHKNHQEAVITAQEVQR